MPELPEIESTRRGIAPYVVDRRVTRVVIRNRALRWPVPLRLSRDLPGQRVRSVDRRAKYLLLRTAAGTVILHLGMSGSLRVLPSDTPAEPHEHVDLIVEEGIALRLRDPRRFGAVLWTRAAPERHVLLASLGPEPLSRGLSGDYLFKRSRGRRVALRDFLLNGRIVAGVGNIYANEVAFRARVDPRRPAGRISRARYGRLAACLKETLEDAITSGGTTFRDFVQSDGRKGGFGKRLRVYGLEGVSCSRCGAGIRRDTLGARSVFFCRGCQR